jgi:hypothetical protein
VKKQVPAVAGGSEAPLFFEILFNFPKPTALKIRKHFFADFLAQRCFGGSLEGRIPKQHVHGS